MRLCILSQEDPIHPQGGTGTYAGTTGSALADAGHDVTVISRLRSGQPRCEATKHFTVYRVPAPGPAVGYSALYFLRTRRLATQLHQIQPWDVIVGNLPMLSSLGIPSDLAPIVEVVHGTVRRELAHSAGVPLWSLNPHERASRFLGILWMAQERRLIRRARHLIAVSPAIRDDLVREYRVNPAVLDVIPNGIDTRRLRDIREDSASIAAARERFGAPAATPTILYLGRLVERKRVLDLVRALPLILEAEPSTVLVVVGKTNAMAQRIADEARALGIGDHLRLIDHVPHEQVPAFLAAADVFALPSSYEGSPFSVLEAMAAGTPVVVSDIPGIRSQVVANRSALFHPVGDVRAIARAILQLLTQPAFAEDIAINALANVALFDIAALTRKTERALMRAIASPHPPPLR